MRSLVVECSKYGLGFESNWWGSCHNFDFSLSPTLKMDENINSFISMSLNLEKRGLHVRPTVRLGTCLAFNNDNCNA